MAAKRRARKSNNRLYSIRGHITKLKIKRNGGHSERGGGAGKAWYEVLHCRYPATPNGMCYENHVQIKVEAQYK